MSKLIAVVLLALFIISNSEARKCRDGLDCNYDELHFEYEAAQRKKKEEKTGRIPPQGKSWYHPNEGYVKGSEGAQREKIKHISRAYIECVQHKANSEAAFDFSMPQGWLYDVFAHSARMRSFFDTGVSEHWVLPNVYCDDNNVLAAMSWMRSHKEMAFKKNKDMHAKFRDSRPPLYSEKEIADKRRELANDRKKGVYCDWSGWLYDSKHGKYRYYFDTSEKELFTFINVYCRDNTVRFFVKSVGGNRDEIDLIYPFKNRHDYELPPAADYQRVGCNWDGWLFGYLLDRTWKDGKGKRRQAYEKYFSVDKTWTSGGGKTWVNGRVMNPFCSREKGIKEGTVTALRVYCFYSHEDRCSDLRDR